MNMYQSANFFTFRPNILFFSIIFSLLLFIEENFEIIINFTY